jgi:formylglycine-generating enzyme required for sulfatase activity
VPGPTTATIKRLFSVAGNRCAFPGCTATLVIGDTVTAEICHIKAQSGGGPRYDPAQTDEERHAFENLLLLCPSHHKVVDQNPDEYTVERLCEIKVAHEARHAGGAEPSDEVVQRLLASVRIEGDVSGQVAIGHDIVQIGAVSGGVINVTYQGTQMAVPTPEAVAAHRAALREKLEADARARWGGMAYYIQEEGATLPVEASPYQEGRLGAREDLLQTLGAADRLLVLGEPGSGKTVALERLAWGMCDGEGAEVPVLVPLRDYAEKSLAEWVLSFLRETGHLRLDDEKALEAFLDQGDCRCTFLFDGLNEVAPPYRDRLIEDLRLWMTAHPRHSVIVTSRSQDELWRRLRGEVGRTVLVQPVGDEQIEAYLVAHLGELGRALHGRLDERLRAMARTPLILWLIKEAGAAGESLPGNRGELCERFVTRMIRRDTRQRQLDAEILDRVKVKALAGLAYRLTLGQRLSCAREEAVALVAQTLDDGQAKQVVRACARHGLLAGEETVWFAPHQTVQEHFAALALQEMVEQERSLSRMGRLRRGVRRVLTGKDEGLAGLAADDWWMETFVQLAGLTDDADWLAREVARANPWLAWWCVGEGREVTKETREVVEHQSVRLLKSELVEDRRRAVRALERIKSERVVGPLFQAVGDADAEVAGLAVQALVGMGESVREEALVLAAQPERPLYRAGLAYLGALLSQPMVWVPPGPFLMGTREEDIPSLLERFGPERRWYEGEMPQHEVVLPGYWIGRYPVTNETYREFIEGGGYQTRAYWTEAGWKWKGSRMQPAYWDDERFSDPQQPVVGVTWYEAMAYCHWLSEKTGVPVRLPSEAEWEKAARGTDGRIYPWGDERPDENRCNFGYYVWRPTPVGKYSPQGDSPHGCADMAGNVWEWCATKWEDNYRDYKGDDDPEGDALRVVRGGCFDVFPRLARCAFRDFARPYLDWNLSGVGFRIVGVTSPIPLRSGS